MTTLADAMQHGADAATVDALLADRKLPIVEGRRVTFLFHGAAEAVELVHWIHGLEQAQPFHRAPHGDLWHLHLDLPEGSRMEYKLAVRRAGQTELIQDPRNPDLAHDPFGANSVVRSSGYVDPDWAWHDPNARPGEIRKLAVPSAVFGDRRVVEVYLPARYRPTRRYPLLVCHDGPDYVSFASLKQVLDNLIERNEIPPLVVALSRPHDRLREYADDERHARHIVEELVPEIERVFPVVPSPSARGLMGASFGAVASLSVASRYPGRFARLLLQSGSFVFTDIGDHGRGAVWDPVVDFVNRYRASPVRVADQVFVSCGTYEGLIYYNRSFVPLLQATGMDVRFLEARDGHNWENWRDRLRDGLTWLFPGPLWHVYE